MEKNYAAIGLILGAVLVLAALTGIMGSTPPPTAGSVTVPKTGQKISVDAVNPQNASEVIDTLGFVYYGGIYDAVSVSSTDWDTTVTEEFKHAKLYVNDYWHIDVWWVSSDTGNVYVQYAVRHGGLSIFDFFRK